MAAGASDGRVIIDTALNNKGFIKGIRAMAGQTDGLRSAVKRLGAVIGTVFAVKTIVDFGKRAVEIGSDIAEVQNVVETAFGELTYKAEEFADTAIMQFGMSTLAAKKTASTYMAMAKGMGVANQEAADMAITLAGLSGDVASFFNISQELADIKLKSVFTGETETLKDLGVVMTQDNLKAYALSKGFKKSYESMSQAEKVGLRYRFVLDSLALANGDFARTQDSWANQTRILSMQWQQFMGILGQSIITVLKPVVKWLNTVMARMIALVNLFNSAVTRVFGGEKKQTAQAEATSDAIGSSVENQDALTDAVEGTNKAQQKSLAGFDEINKLSDEAAGSGEGGGAGADLGGMDIPELMEVPELEELPFASWGEAFDAFLDAVIDEGIPKLRAGFERFAEWLNGFTGKLYEALTFPGIAKKIRMVGTDLAQAVNHLVDCIDWRQLGAALGAGLDLGLQFLVSALYSFDWIAWGGSLAALVNGAVGEIDWYAYGQFLWSKFKIAIETFAGFIQRLNMPELAEAASDIIIGFFDSMKETFEKIDWDEIGAQIAEFLNNIKWDEVITSISGAIESFVEGIIGLIGGFIENADPDTLLIACGFLAAKILPGLINKTIKPLAEKLVSEVIEKIAETLMSSGFAAILKTVGTTIAGIGSIIDGVILAASSFFSMWNEGFSWAKEVIMLFGIALTAVGAIILGAPALVAGVIAAIVAAIATFVVVFKDQIAEAFNAFLEWISNIGQSISDGVAWVIQTVIDTFNGIVSTFQVLPEWFRVSVVEPAKQFFAELFQTVRQLASAAWAAVQQTWSVVSGWFDSMVVQPVARFFTGLWISIQQGASQLWTSIQGVWSAAAGWFTQHVTEPLKSAFGGVKTFVTGVFSGLIGGVEGMVNSVIKAVNWLVTQINKIKFDVPDWVPGVGGKKFGFNLPKVSEVKLPRLAQGAVIPPNREFLAVLGDQRSGNNLEGPEDMFRKIVREEAGGGGDYTPLLQAILEAIREGNVIVMDGKALTRGIVRNINTMTRQNGKSVILR